MTNEKKTDFFIGKLLDLADIKFTPNGSEINEIQNALKTASKQGTGKAGFPEFTAKQKEFILIIEDKADIEKQADYIDLEETKLGTTIKSITNYAENGALEMVKSDIYSKFSAQTILTQELKNILSQLKGKTMTIDKDNSIIIEETK